MQEQYKCGIDLGGTKIEGVVLDVKQENKILFRERIPTLSDHGYSTVLGQIKKMVELLEDKTATKFTKLGLGTPGRLDPESRLIKNSNSVCLNEKPMLEDLQNLLGIPVKIENDANCFAVSEAAHLRSTIAADAEIVFGIIMGTGVGGGIVVNGKVITGLHGIGGEWGHNFLDESGGQCYCGRVGCVETILSGPALERYYESLTGNKLKLKAIVEAAKNNSDQAAIKTMDRLHKYFGKATANILNVLDPAYVVIGGGVGNIDSIYTEGVAETEKYLFNDKMKTKFLKPKFGDSSGVIGAALLF